MDKRETTVFVEDTIMPALANRLGEYRLAHSQSVAKTAKSLAKIYGVDPNQAYLAGMLHDWDKDISEDELFEHARSHNIPIPENHSAAVSILHAQTGAAVLHDTYPQIEPAVLQAVSRHTLGALDMTDLDMVLYCSDLLEPLRSKKAIEDIRLDIGNVSLEELYTECYACSMRFLIEKRRYIHPDAITFWNRLVTAQK